MFDSLFIHIRRADASTGILYDRVVPFANITDFTIYPTLDTSQNQHFIQSYSELYRAAFLPAARLPFNPNELQNLINNMSIANTIDIGILHYKFNIMDTNVMLQKIYFDMDSVLREDTSVISSLYMEKTAFIATPLTKSIEEADVSFRIPDSLFFDNTGISIAEMFIDFDDGLGLRAVNFNAFISVSYPQEGLKTLIIKAILANGDTLITYAKLDYSSIPQHANQPSGHPYIENLIGDNAIIA